MQTRKSESPEMPGAQFEEGSGRSGHVQRKAVDLPSGVPEGDCVVMYCAPV
jgi:hypothetical protein